MIFNTKKSRFWRNWQLRTQVCMIQFIITIIAIILIILSTLLILFYISDTQMQSSQQAFQNQFGKWTKIIMYHQIQRVQQTLFRSQNQIQRVNKLYQLSQQLQQPNVSKPYPCLNDLIHQDKYAYSASFCYLAYGSDENGEMYKKLKDLCGILTETVQMIDHDFDVIFASTNDVHFFAAWPGFYLAQDYNPQKRIWYTNHLEQVSKNNKSQTYFCEPHIHWTWKVLMIAQTASLLDINGSLDGVIASHVNFSQFKYQDDGISFTIMNPDGRILLSQLNISEASYIYDYKLTQLDYKDYQQIINQANKRQTKSDCDSQRWKDFGYLCRKIHNSTEEELIDTKIMDNEGLVLIIQCKLSQYQKLLQQMFDNFESGISQIFLGTILGSFGYMFSSALITSIIIIILFNPIIKIINQTSQYVFKENFSMQHKLQNKPQLLLFKRSKSNTLIEKLQISFNQLIHRSINPNKSLLCLLIEQFKYPVKRWQQRRKVQKILKFLSFLENNLENQEITDKQIQFVQQLIKTYQSTLL
ncbi:unnamed protein product (macronuclear) [Paramecium tetraurelia]|uniref:Cache domain-containing protein n=1 Tax=Paramecium tetraurelia TaxID=5888 RepID=A0D8K7_PARTE|nr:uncharacterized protein GSPATT00014320001 [Paramecium tetraurelia]CAK79374.1 unnamed protein product [Paramecium tetraurelia]|eukprot:XP_001446771.1 hypothetical protein (macronuclear) [Paramecium tetraurelia strain d4-2]